MLEKVMRISEEFSSTSPNLTLTELEKKQGMAQGQLTKF